MDNRQEDRQARQEARHERHSTKHIPTDTPLAEEKILNTDRTEIHKLIADAVKIQLSEKTASKLETEQSASERLANVSALDYVVDGKVVRPTLVQQAENPNRGLSYGPPSNRVEHTEQRSAALEQPFAKQKEPPKMREIIKTEKAIFDERLKEMEQKMEQKTEEKMAALEKKLNEKNEKLTEINQSLSKENLDLIIRLNALEQPAASTPATNTPETNKTPAATNSKDLDKVAKELIAVGTKIVTVLGQGARDVGLGQGAMVTSALVNVAMDVTSALVKKATLPQVPPATPSVLPVVPPVVAPGIVGTNKVRTVVNDEAMYKNNKAEEVVVDPWGDVDRGF